MTDIVKQEQHWEIETEKNALPMSLISAEETVPTI